ncbi:MAG: ATP-binding protein [Deltaproteobacteria bacterium]|nr:ATP-binding protein [Deltaproteobacteria bacterium]
MGRTIKRLIEKTGQFFSLRIRSKKEELDRLKHIFNMLDEGIILIDDNQFIIYCNPIALGFIGLESFNGPIALTDFKDKTLSNLFIEVIQSKKDCDWNEVKFFNRYYKVDLRIHFEEKLLVFFDITDERKYQNYKTELIGNLSHELRTPLSMIMGYAETLSSEKEMPVETSRRFINKILEHSIHINGIIRDVLELQKIDFIGDQFEVDFPVIVKNIIKDIQVRFSGESEKELLFNVDVEELYLLYDHFFSILTNLIENAIKYSKGKKIHISIYKQDRNITIQVEDEGPLIPNAEKTRIFERFYTVSKSRNIYKSGTGLGLPIVKHITQLYHGKIDLSEGKFHGNLFKVSLIEKI